MHATRMLLAFLTSFLLLAGCAHDGPTLRLMNDRAEYEDEATETSELNLGSSGALGEVGKLKARPEPRVAHIWVHPQRISGREHFWGAWISLNLEDDHWEAKTLDRFEQAQPTAKPKDDGKTKRRQKK